MLNDLGRFEEPALLVLTSLANGPAHGYAISRDIHEIAAVKLGPGTLYATLSRLEARGLIEGLPASDRRRPYRLTPAGAAVLDDRLERLEAIAGAGRRRLAAGR